MFAAGFVLRLLECGVADVDLALLAPESGLGLLGFFFFLASWRYTPEKTKLDLLLISRIRPY